MRAVLNFWSFFERRNGQEQGAGRLLALGRRPLLAIATSNFLSLTPSLAFDSTRHTLIMASDAKPYHVLIIGGGIAGPVLGLALQKVGVSCALYEAYPYVDTVGGGFNIAPNGMHVLNQLGLAEELVQRCAHADMAYFRDETGSELGQFPFGPSSKFELPAVSMSRSLLYSILAKAVKDRGLPMHYEKKLVSYDDSTHADCVVATFEDGTTARGNIIIGADGVRSVVRSQMLPNGPAPEYTGLIGIGGFVETAQLQVPATDFNALTFSFGPQGFFGWGGAEDGKLMWWSNWTREQPYEREEITSFDVESLKTELLGLFGTWPAPIPDCIRNTTDILRHNVFDIQNLPQWSRGRALLIGDAAHAVSPTSGQGVSLALEDAICIVNLLKKHNFNHTAAFNTFEKERKPRCEAIIAEGRRQSASKGQVSWLTSKIRGFFLKMIFKFTGPARIHEVMAYRADLDVTPITPTPAPPVKTRTASPEEPDITREPRDMLE